MKVGIFICVIFLNFSLVMFGQSYDSHEVTRLREIREKSFRDRNSTPLLAADFARFKGLPYFELSGSYLIKAEFIKTTDEKSFLMPTSTGGTRKYLKIGVLKFKVADQDCSLSAFVRENDPDNLDSKGQIRDLFLPFRDLTNVSETYNAGRYLYARMPKTGEAVILDFNLSFNPNCAYGNSNFVCTLPPKENFLQVEIKAGEKRFSVISKSKH